MAFGGKMEHTMTGIILSANDVIADVLIINEDEDRTAPVDFRQVELPYDTKTLRVALNRLEPYYKRGEVVKITVSVEKELRAYDEKIIHDLTLLLADAHEDEADAIFMHSDETKRAAAEWPNVLSRMENDRLKEKVS